MDEFPLKRVSAYLGGPFLNSSQLRLSLIHQEPPKLFHLCVKSITRKQECIIYKGGFRRGIDKSVATVNLEIGLRELRQIRKLKRFHA
jgi:hypothetical protein